jgi:hypothetical protein
MEKESVSKFSQLKAMVIRNITLKKRSGRKTVAVSKPITLFHFVHFNQKLNLLGVAS